MNPLYCPSCIHSPVNSPHLICVSKPSVFMPCACMTFVLWMNKTGVYDKGSIYNIYICIIDSFTNTT